MAPGGPRASPLGIGIPACPRARSDQDLGADPAVAVEGPRRGPEEAENVNPPEVSTSGPARRHLPAAEAARHERASGRHELGGVLLPQLAAEAFLDVLLDTH